MSNVLGAARSRRKTPGSADTQRTPTDVVESDVKAVVAGIAKSVGELGVSLSKIGGDVQDISRDVTEKTKLLGDLSASSSDISVGNSMLRSDTRDLLVVAETVDSEMEASRDAAQRSRDDVSELASWIERAGGELQSLNSAMSSISEVVSRIDSIAQQTHILALNARIEAMRAGEHGVGFVVIANSVRDLSDQTISAAHVIAATISPLITSIKSLGSSASIAREKAFATRVSSTEILTSVESVKRQMLDLTASLERVGEFSDRTATTSAIAEEQFSSISTSLTENAERLYAATEEIGDLTTISEWLIGQAVLTGVKTDDAKFVELVVDAAGQVAQRFKSAIASGIISEGDLFDEDYVEISGTNPTQYLTRFTRFTDEVLPEIQEKLLLVSESVVFAACVDRNGYLPTHNLKFSKPQGDDPEWNNSNSRNRRLFLDRTGLGAAKSTRPFYIQTYRRDMGGGVFHMMKDVSAPIYVDGRHWGGLRLAYETS